MIKSTDDQLLSRSAALAEHVMGVVEQNGQEPEEAWIILALATDAVERALTYCAKTMPTEAGRNQSARDLVEGRERLKQLLELSGVQHTQAEGVIAAEGGPKPVAS